MYVARDKDGDLYLYKDHPIKCSESWQPSKTSNDWIKLYPSLFPEVKWEDEEPTEVELVKKKGYNMKVLAISFREEISSILDRLIEACNNGGDSTREMPRAAEHLKMELEKYTERH